MQISSFKGNGIIPGLQCCNQDISVIMTSSEENQTNKQAGDCLNSPESLEGIVFEVIINDGLGGKKK